MIFDYTYLLEKFNAAFFNNPNAQVSHFIIPIDDMVIGRKPDLFRNLHDSKNKFCFYIPLELTRLEKQFVKKEIILNLTRFFFLHNYIRVNGNYILCVQKVKEKEQQIAMNLLKSEFKNELKKQGINISMIEILDEEAPSDDFSNKYCIYINHPELTNYLHNGGSESEFESISRSFMLPIYLNKRWIVPVSNPDDFQNKYKLIQNFENWLTYTAPFKVEMIRQFRLVGRNSDKLLSEKKILEFKLENSAFYLQLIREESVGFANEIKSLRGEVERLTHQIINQGVPFSPANASSADNQDLISQLQNQIVAEHERGTEILEWYKKEYEILPLWYKRFGQLVKVLIGKRTFKSFFKKKK